MDTQKIMASTFKQQCLALLDQVARTRVPIIITKHGQPVAQLMPLDDPPGRSTMGSVRLLAEDDEAYFSTGEAWEADNVRSP